MAVSGISARAAFMGFMIAVFIDAPRCDAVIHTGVGRRRTRVTTRAVCFFPAGE